MPKLKRRSDEDGERVDALLAKAQTSVLTPDELKEVLWILAPVTDSPAFYHDGEQFYFDQISGELYSTRGGERFYVGLIPDTLSSLTGGKGGNRGGGLFARLAPRSRSLNIPLPPFPKIPPNVKAKFPELTESWNKWEKSVEQWVQYVQQQLS